MITTGEGGAALTNNANLAEKMTLLRSHGVTRDRELLNKPTMPDWYYEQLCLGLNYRMTDIQAALGISQLKKLPTYLQKRNEIASVYTEDFRNSNISCPKILATNYSSFHLYIVRFDNIKIKKTRDDVFDYLRKNNILVNVHYSTIYKHPYFQKLGIDFEACIEAEKYSENALSLPIYPRLNYSELNKVTSKILDFLG